MYSWLLDRDKALKVGFFSAYKDNTGFPSEEKKETIKSLLLRTTNAIRATHPDTFKRFLIEKEMHCLDDYAYQVDGVAFWDWVDYLVNDDPRWSDMLE